ncbi:MAG: hypothetical protein H2212_04015 [Ruminococcus sp.]|nr:hypothetical protein [Ruminococcus sp.]
MAPAVKSKRIEEAAERIANICFDTEPEWGKSYAEGDGHNLDGAAG